MRLAAALTTAGVMLLVLLPLGVALVVAGNQMIGVTKDVVLLLQEDQANGKSELADGWQRLREDFNQLDPEWRERLAVISKQAAEGMVKRVPEKTVGLVQDAVNAVVGLVVMTLALYYLLLDGVKILKEVKELTPLDDVEEDALIEEFGKVCRGVVVGTVVAAMVQALLAGIGFFVAGVENVPLLMVLTMIFAFIPFVGASGRRDRRGGLACPQRQLYDRHPTFHLHRGGRLHLRQPDPCVHYREPGKDEPARRVHHSDRSDPN